ncbi:MAG: helix-turn-helix domain-containing protein [Gemmataceae bacterium]
MKLAKAIAIRIKSLRDEAHLSQQELAVKAELSLSLVAKLEQGKKGDPRASSLLALAGALGIQPGKLLNDLFPPGTVADDDDEPAPKKPKKKRGKKKQS